MKRRIRELAVIAAAVALLAFEAVALKLVAPIVAGPVSALAAGTVHAAPLARAASLAPIVEQTHVTVICRNGSVITCRARSVRRPVTVRPHEGTSEARNMLGSALIEALL